MTRKRASREPAPIAPAPADHAPDSPDPVATGVASGGLGTGANLEETQVLRTTDIEAFERAELEDAPPRVDPAPVARPRVRSSSPPARGLAGALALAFVFLAGVAILATRDDGSAGAAPALPPAGSVTTAETAAPDREEGREGDDDDGKKCNGKGRGNNCEGGGD